MNKNNIDEKNKSVSEPTKTGITALKSRIAELDKKLETASGKKIEPYKFSGVVYLIIDCSLSMKEGYTETLRGWTHLICRGKIE